MQGFSSYVVLPDGDLADLASVQFSWRCRLITIAR